VAQEPAERKRALGLGSSTALVIGNMIGSGIFLLPASLAAYGGISIVGWLFTAVGAMLLAMLFAKLASMVPKVGGPYAYSRLGFGDFAGFWIAWGYWISVWVGNAAIAVALVSYLGGVIPVLGQQLWLSGLVSVGLIWLVTWINVMGVKHAGVFQVITTIMKLVPLVAMATLGLFWVNWSHFVPFNTSGMSPFTAVTEVTALTLWAFLGVESATIPADDVKNPNKTIPRATVFGTIVVSTAAQIRLPNLDTGRFSRPGKVRRVSVPSGFQHVIFPGVASQTNQAGTSPLPARNSPTTLRVCSLADLAWPPFTGVSLKLGFFRPVDGRTEREPSLHPLGTAFCGGCFLGCQCHSRKNAWCILAEAL